MCMRQDGLVNPSIKNQATYCMYQENQRKKNFFNIEDV